MLKAILSELGETQLAALSMIWWRKINKVLLARIEEGRDIVLIIDEARTCPSKCWNRFGSCPISRPISRKLLQIVLMGQPELKAILARDELRQLRQRILIHYELDTLSVIDLAHYVRHRLSLAGRQRSSLLHPQWALRAIQFASKGIPRVVNNLCDKALLAALFARLRRGHVVGRSPCGARCPSSGPLNHVPRFHHAFWVSPCRSPRRTAISR
jgi:general secretion pathway protein A